MHSDPVADMLTRIRNASRARRQQVSIPRSNLKVRVAEILKSEGFVADYREIAGKVPGQSVIELTLKYDGKREPVIAGIQRCSRPGLRQYVRHADVARRKIRNGLGVMILTTSRGLMTDREARRQQIGGEALCVVW